jgi:transposase
LAARGRSKEKRSDCPLVTLALVLDGSGFPRMSQVFAGNVGEPSTLKAMIDGLNARPGATVVLDAGIVSQANIDWLVQHGYHYLVVSRQEARQFDEAQAVVVKQSPQNVVKVQRVVDEDTGEVRLYCQSTARQQKEQAMQNRFAERFEAELQTLADGLHKKTGIKQYDKVVERIGRKKQKYASAAQHYQIQVTEDKATGKATSIRWQRQDKAGSQATHPGVYCLRSDLTDPDETTLWRLYTMLTDLEAVFRSLKSELGLRPIYHHKTDRVRGHLFISVLAYHLVHLIRTQLKAHARHDSWQTLRHRLASQQRVTVMLEQRNGKTAHIRKATRPEPEQTAIYQALGISLYPGDTQKTLV